MIYKILEELNFIKFVLKDVDWSSSLSTLEKGQSKKEFDKIPVLDRMKIQLEKNNIPTKYIKDIDLSWAINDLTQLIKKYTNRNYILLFPFCSKKHQDKRWPYFKELISQLRRVYKNQYSIFLAPGPNEIEEANKLNANIILNDGKALSIKMLVSLINKAKFIIANDTGPAHIASHLKKMDLLYLVVTNHRKM